MPRISADDARWILLALEHTLSNSHYGTEVPRLRAIHDKLSRRLAQNQQAGERSRAARREVRRRNCEKGNEK